MDYSLAKELKDAGFPNSSNWFDDGRTMWGGTDMEPPAPTLEELIEACGEDLDCLFSGFERIDEGYLHKNQWRADATNRTGYSCAGETPTEAVARLWLALNKK